MATDEEPSEYDEKKNNADLKKIPRKLDFVLRSSRVVDFNQPPIKTVSKTKKEQGNVLQTKTKKQAAAKIPKKEGLKKSLLTKPQLRSNPKEESPSENKEESIPPLLNIMQNEGLDSIKKRKHSKSPLHSGPNRGLPEINAVKPSISVIFNETVWACNKGNKMATSEELSKYAKEKYNVDLKSKLGEVKCVLRNSKVVDLNQLPAKTVRKTKNDEGDVVKTKTKKTQAAVKNQKKISLKKEPAESLQTKKKARSGVKIGKAGTKAVKSVKQTKSNRQASKKKTPKK